MAVWAGRGWPVARRRPAQRLDRASCASPSTTARSSARSTRVGPVGIVHPGAIYLHQGQTLPGDRARPRRRRRHRRAVRRRRVDPAPQSITDITILGERAAPAGGPQPAARSGAVRGALAGGRLPALRHAPPASCSAPRSSSCPPASWSPARSGTRSSPALLAAAGVAPGRGARARCTPSSTPPSACCRCSPSATAGTSAGCRPPLQAETGLPDDRRSTTATRAAPASPSSATPAPTATSPPPSR